MKKALIITMVVVAAIVVGFGLYSHFNAQFPHLVVNDESAEELALFPLSEGYIEVADGVNFLVDTGCSVSMLSEADAEALRKQGVEIEEEWFPSIARDFNEKLFMVNRRYRVNLPVRDFKIAIDSTGIEYYLPTGRNVATLHGLVFLPSPEGQVSLIGTDILERFCVEIRENPSAVALYKELPEGYNRVTPLLTPSLTNSILGCGERYYVELETENVANRYFIDSGIDRVAVRLPESDTVIVKSKIRKGVYKSPAGEVNAGYCDAGWVKIGNRAGSYRIHFANDGVEPYALNPLEFFGQDFVLDFANRMLYLRPTAQLARVRY